MEHGYIPNPLLAPRKPSLSQQEKQEFREAALLHDSPPLRVAPVSEDAEFQLFKKRAVFAAHVQEKEAQTVQEAQESRPIGSTPQLPPKGNAHKNLAP